MADIFIAYDRRDKECASNLAQCLALEGWTVFWDEQIGAERFRQVIEREIRMARTMVCLWSPLSSKNDNVLSEADCAKRSQLPLVALLLDVDRPPLFLDQDNGLPLSGWSGDRETREFRRLVQALDGIVPRGTATSNELPGPCVSIQKINAIPFAEKVASDAKAGVKSHLGHALRVVREFFSKTETSRDGMARRIALSIFYYLAPITTAVIGTDYGVPIGFSIVAFFIVAAISNKYYSFFSAMIAFF